MKLRLTNQQNVRRRMPCSASESITSLLPRAGMQASPSVLCSWLATELIRVLLTFSVVFLYIIVVIVWIVLLVLFTLFCIHSYEPGHVSLNSLYLLLWGSNTPCIHMPQFVQPFALQGAPALLLISESSLILSFPSPVSCYQLLSPLESVSRQSLPSIFFSLLRRLSSRYRPSLLLAWTIFKASELVVLLSVSPSL